MRITARGWRRDSGPTTLSDFEVKDCRPDNVATYRGNVPYLKRTQTGVEIRVGPQALTLGGRYQLMVRLTEDDITRLFLELHPDLRRSIEIAIRDDDRPAAAAE
jgi:hypothetical protein